MCGAISVPCATEGCDKYTKEVYCFKCKAKEIMKMFDNLPRY